VPPARRRSRADRARDTAVDLALQEVGIGPGDPRLHHGARQPLKPDAGAGAGADDR
jgi:hypothetical protein